MAKVDLHCHTIYSELPSHWFMRHVNHLESYTSAETLYQKQKAAGMDFVTVTDHNRIGGCLELMERYDDVIMGVEATVAFPEDGCLAHLLIYDFTPEQFETIQQLRSNIYQLRDFMLEHDLPHSLAHAMFTVNRRLTVEHVEKLILLFDNFEHINGGRGKGSNDTMLQVVEGLTPELMDELSRKHGILPNGDEPWRKGLTGGSDDHSALYLGQTWTEASDATTKDEFLDALRGKRTTAAGRHSSFETLSFNVLKIALDHAAHEGKALASTPVGMVAPLLFEGDMSSPGGQLLSMVMLAGNNPMMLKGMLGQSGNDSLTSHLEKHPELIEKLMQHLGTLMESSECTDSRLKVAFDALSDVVDHIATDLVESFGDMSYELDLMGLAQKLSTIIPTALSIAPFLVCLHEFKKDHQLILKTNKRFKTARTNEPKRVLWFTDTLNDLNGVSATLKAMGWASHMDGKQVKLATALKPHEREEGMPPQLLELPIAYDFPMPYYSKLEMRVPSLLKALRAIADYDPDQIIISTPGPVGLVGLFAAKIMSIKVKGVYHTDFHLQAKEISGDASLALQVERFTMWFYRQMDRVLVPSESYMDVLKERGLKRKKMRLFPRGIESDTFAPVENAGQQLRQRFGLDEHPVLLYTGRISKDKNLGLLLDAHRALAANGFVTNLLLVGDGPHVEELQAAAASESRIHFTGAIDRAELPTVYSGSDLLVFPSLTDTFGMTVLEAQSCGLPAIVSAVGGPQDIVRHGESGTVVGEAGAAPTLQQWLDATTELLTLRASDPAAYEAYGLAGRRMAIARFDWRRALDEMLIEPDDQ